MVLITTAIAACQTKEPLPTPPTTAIDPENCRTITHQLGETEICGQPQKVVVLGPYLLEQVLALGGQPVGYGDHIALHQGDYDDPSQQIPYLGERITTQPVNVGLAYQPSIEAILKAQPDLILSPTADPAQYEQLAAIAPTLSFDTTGGKSNLMDIGQALDKGDRAAALTNQIEEQIQQAKTQFAPIVQRHPRVLMLTAENTQTFSLISHTNSRCGALVQELGFEPVYPENFTADDSSSVPTISLEALPELNGADSVVLFGYQWQTNTATDATAFDQQQNNSLKQSWDNNAIAQSLDASKAGRVYFIPAYLCLGLPGPIGTELYLEELKAQLLLSHE
ncbi:MAG: iron-siderophore ABC transporter substrate-binding protein [Cyanobacteria bacterium P01_G01_bin.54]